jgi:hypothetical protein
MNSLNKTNIIRALIIILLLFSKCMFSQEITQTIKGRIVDTDSEISIPGATVIIANSDPTIGTVTDIDGYFRLENVPVGRISLQFSSIGYETQYINDILISSGKELDLSIPLKESISSLGEVVIRAEEKKRSIKQNGYIIC